MSFVSPGLHLNTHTWNWANVAIWDKKKKKKKERSFFPLLSFQASKHSWNTFNKCSSVFSSGLPILRNAIKFYNSFCRAISTIREREAGELCRNVRADDERRKKKNKREKKRKRERERERRRSFGRKSPGWVSGFAKFAGFRKDSFLPRTRIELHGCCFIWVTKAWPRCAICSRCNQIISDKLNLQPVDVTEQRNSIINVACATDCGPPLRGVNC